MVAVCLLTLLALLPLGRAETEPGSRRGTLSPGTPETTVTHTSELGGVGGGFVWSPG